MIRPLQSVRLNMALLKGALGRYASESGHIMLTLSFVDYEADSEVAQRPDDFGFLGHSGRDLLSLGLPS